MDLAVIHTVHDAQRAGSRPGRAAGGLDRFVGHAVVNDVFPVEISYFEGRGAAGLTDRVESTRPV